jgi:uncharacterized NAD(P)/FAD-binding protein YdhS
MRDVVAVIGGGASGTFAALHLVRPPHGFPVILLDRAAAFGRGVAYGTEDPAHLLNVPAAKMSAFPDAESHFQEWLVAREPQSTGESFARRSQYGDYLAGLLYPSGSVRREGEVRSLEAHGRGLRLTLAKGDVVEARGAVLALGNLAPELPRGWEALPKELAWRSPWISAPSWPPLQSEVLLVGAGLTAVDVVLSLAARGHRGRIHVLSRRGLLPWTHLPTALAPVAAGELPRRLRPLLAHFRRLAARHDPRAVMDALRPVTVALWGGLSDAERASFLRHLRPWFDALRHRLAPQVGARVAELQARGQLLLHAGRVEEMSAAGGALRVRFRPRRARAVETLTVGLAVPCMGPAQHLGHTSDALLRSLLERGQARPGPQGLGLATAPDGAVLGPLADRLWTLAVLRRGDLWETTAIPEIRVQAQELARTIAARVSSS